jgi:hypothetical protein
MARGCPAAEKRNNKNTCESLTKHCPIISYVPGPPGQKTMFNFRAVFNQAPEQTDNMLETMRSLPLPKWQPPPH